MAENGSLNRRQRRFVAALLGVPTIEKAAVAAGIAERTAYRYLKHRAVMRALASALDDATGQATRRAVGAMTEALLTLEAIHQDEEAPAGARVAAARAILDAGPRLREAQDLARRVTELEERTHHVQNR